MSTKISHEGELDLNGFKIPCFVLEDGKRVLSTTGMQKALGVTDNEPNQRSSGRLDEILTSKVVRPFLHTEDSPSKFKPITCFQGNRKISAYDATILPEICEVMLKVRDYAKENKVELGIRQQAVVAQADILIRALAKVGIIALVDEATGFVKDKNRAKDELQKFLKQFMREEAAKWVKRFEDSFFEMIYKMRGWTWNYTHKHPGVVGIWINDIVYERIAPLVLAELKKKNPPNDEGVKSKKNHSFLSEEVGIPKLLNHLAAVEALGRASNYNWNRFMEMLDRAFPKQYQQLTFVFDDPPEQDKNESLSDFNQKLDKALKYNPKKEDGKSNENEK